MAEVFKADPAAMARFSAANRAAGDAIIAAASADWEAANAAAATALGPIGAVYLAAHFPAQHTCVAKTFEVGGAHHGISDTTDGSTAAIVAADNS